MLLAIAGLSSVAMAQTTGYENVPSEKYSVFTNGFWNNWFFSIGGGAEMTLGNRDVHGSIGDRISPTFNASLGKWFTPGLGLRLQYSGFQSRGYTDDPNNGYIDSRADQYGYYEQKFKYMNLHGDILFNVSAMLGGYNPDRVYEFIPYLGAGFTHSYSSPKREAMAINGGIINRFRVSPSVDINLELSVMGVENKFDGELGGNNDFDGVVAATLGLTYRFKTRDFQKPQAMRQLISESELRDMRNRMNMMATENQSLKDQLAKQPDVVSREVVRTVADINSYAVFFQIGSSAISDREKVNIGLLADYLKKYPDLKVQLVGYADSATGSSQLNQRLSVDRAQAVANMLVNEFGISRDRVATEGEGGVEKYQKIYLNRMVMIESDK